MAHLTLVLDNREVRKFVLNKGVTTIGRAQDNDIVINNLALSRRHAQVEYKGGRYEVVDLQSQNGVYVNAERVRVPRTLGDKDSITLGTYQFVFRSGEADPEPEISVPPRERVAPRPAPVSEPSSDDVEEEDVPLLVMKYNDVELQRTPLRGARCLIGRARECDLQVPERRLSRKHCEIILERGKYVLHDLGSQNGTYVNRRRIRGEQELKHGDILNFAEYSVLFIADRGAYRGADSREVDAPSADALVNGETIMPPAYASEHGYTDEPIQPSDFDDPADESRPRPPVVMTPRKSEPPADPLTRSPAEARARRKGQVRAIREKPRTGSPPEVEAPVQPRKSEAPLRSDAPPAKPRTSAPPAPAAKKSDGAKDKPGKRPAQEIRGRPAKGLQDELTDVPDESPLDREDEGLEEWYQSRREKSSLYEEEQIAAGIEPRDDEEDSVLLQRPASSVSQVLSTMMVDKRELDRNLRGSGARQRKFYVDVRHGNRVLYSGPLTQAVTILGTDREADIKLKGRYVAGRHSLLVRVRDSLLLVRLGSTSAARVNGLPKLQAFLKTGDVVQIDETTIKISED